MQCNLLDFCPLIASFCGTEDKVLQKIALGSKKTSECRKSGVRRDEVWSRRDEALQEEDRKWSGLWLGRGNQSRVMSQAGCCSSASPGAVSLLRNMFWGLRGHDCHWHRLWAAVWTGLSKRAQGQGSAQGSQPRERLDLQSTGSLNSSAARHRLHKQFSFSVFREADDLMTEGQIYRRVEKGNGRGFR